MENVKICFDCGCIIENDDYYETQDGFLCSDCYDDNYTICDDCGEIIRVDDGHWIEYKSECVCDNCFNDNYIVCANCGEITHRYDSYDTTDGDVCEYCYHNCYIECYECGEIVHQDYSTYDENTDKYYCNTCYDNLNEFINDYCYKPSPLFYGTDNNMFMGIELEIDEGGHLSENAENLLNIDGKDRIYCKHDGSLNDGFEIVSHPMTLHYHINNMCWSDILEKCVNMGYQSHNTSTCGLHIHISKNSLGNTFEQIDDTIANILYFVEKHWQKMLLFSRRTQENINRWATRYGIEPDDTPKKLLDKAKKNFNRYQAINLLPTNTIEFRFFRGTLKYSTFIATLQLVYFICNFCKNVDNINNFNWLDFISYIEKSETQHNELIEYMKKRGI